MNEFRAKLLGKEPTGASLLKAKGARKQPAHAAEDESFSDLTIPRDSARQSHHRDEDRHRLASEQVAIAHDGAVQRVSLINLSGGGAMIEGATGLRLWDRVELHLGDCGPVEAAVRWIKSDRIGLEFAHETRIETGTEELATMLQAVLDRSFADVVLAASQAVEPADAGDPEPVKAAREEHERELRHPLIWSGTIHFNHDSTPVRLRNISSGGALIEGGATCPVGAELLLDLGGGGTIFATVHWARGDTVGLKFHTAFDLAQLAAARPEITSARWVAPDYLRTDRSAMSPWASQWGRIDLAGLQRYLRKPRS